MRINSARLGSHRPLVWDFSNVFFFFLDILAIAALHMNIQRVFLKIEEFYSSTSTVGFHLFCSGGWWVMGWVVVYEK